MAIVQSLTNSMDANLMPCIVIQFSGRFSLSTACAVLTWVPFSCYVPELSHYLISFSCNLRFQGTRTRHSRETWEQRHQFSWAQNTIFGKRHSCPEENNGNLRRTYTYTCRTQYPQTDMLCGVHGIRAWNNSPLVILLSFQSQTIPKCIHSSSTSWRCRKENCKMPLLLLSLMESQLLLLDHSSVDWDWHGVVEWVIKPLWLEWAFHFFFWHWSQATLDAAKEWLADSE